MEKLKKIIFKSKIFAVFKYYWLLKDEYFVFITLLASPFAFFFINFGGLRIFFIYYLMIFLVIAFKTKKIAISLLLTYLFTSQFIAPAKTYQVTVIDYLYNSIFDFKSGYLKEYGVNTSNIFLVFLILFIISTLFEKWRSKFLKDNIFLLLTSCFFIFLFAGYLSSYNYSPYFFGSIAWLLQYSQVFLTGIVIYLIYKHLGDKFSLIIPTILAISFFQSFISLLQFIKQSSLGIMFENNGVIQANVENTDLIGNIFRVVGTFNHANQLGLVVVLLFCALLPHVFSKKSFLFVVASVLLFITLLLTQSRSAWLSFIGVLAVFIYIFLSEVKKVFWNFLKIKRYVIYLSLLFVLVSYVIVPRILLSLSVFTETGGGFDLRKKMLNEAVEVIKGSYLFGYGPGTNEYVLYDPGDEYVQYYLQSEEGYVRSFPGAIHNGFFQLILEVGLVGFAAFILPFIAIFYLEMRYLIASNILVRNMSPHYKTLLFNFIAGFLAFSLFYIFQPHWGQYDFVFLGIVLGFGMILLKENEKRTV